MGEKARSSEEQTLSDGSAWRIARLASGALCELVPLRRRAALQLGAMAAWLAFVSVVIWNIVRGRTSFIFVPIVIVPVTRSYRALCVSLNRVRFRIDADRTAFDQGPLPNGRPVELPTRDVRCFRELELDAYVGGWLSRSEARFWTVTIVRRAGEAEALPFVVRSESVARRVAADLNGALDALREPASYRG